MGAETKRIIEQALALPRLERGYIAEALVQSLAETSEHEIDPAWREEILRRLEDLRNGDVQAEPLSEVRRQIREALAR